MHFLRKHCSSGMRAIILFCVVILFPACHEGNNDEIEKGTNITTYTLDDGTKGALQQIGHLKNISIVSINDNNNKAEYQAGFVNGHLLKDSMVSARDNFWDAAYRVSPEPIFPTALPPPKAEMELAEKLLKENYAYTVMYAETKADPELRKKMLRIFFRLLGVYHGAKHKKPLDLDFSGRWMPSLEYFTAEELILGYETPGISFLDLYFLNAFADLLDAVSGRTRIEKCTAFVKKSADDILMAHNSWFPYLDMSMLSNYYINGDFFSFNVMAPGVIYSQTSFGYNNHGIMFCETTIMATQSEPKTKSLWMAWREALASQFSVSMDDFYDLLSLEASGTYMNSYMVVDVNKNEIGLIEMSYDTFVYFKPNKENGYDVITKPESGVSKEYDHEMLQPDYILGFNYAVSLFIRDQLKSINNRPARQTQLLSMINDVSDVEAAKDLITFTDDLNPLSIYGRWDLGYGDTPTPKTVAEGA
ncbi:MAG: hypothetical protein GY846_19910, partial [Deltaproteobacteria bacterium]|nr:hypothetical protein [Deltaproteobacteria bacterium]